MVTDGGRSGDSWRKYRRRTSVDVVHLVAVGSGGKRRRVVPATFKNNNRHNEG